MAALDVITLAEAKLAVSSNAGTSNDTLLASYITGVSGYLDRICGPIVIRTVTDEIHDGGDGMVFLKERPVVTVSAVSEYAGTTETALTGQTIGTAPANGYQLNAGAGYLTRLAGGYGTRFACGVGNVKVSYTAGRYVDTEAVDQKFKRAAGFTLANIWRREQGMASNYEVLAGVTYLLPNAAAALLTGELQVIL